MLICERLFKDRHTHMQKEKKTTTAIVTGDRETSERVYAGCPWVAILD